LKYNAQKSIVEVPCLKENCEGSFDNTLLLKNVFKDDWKESNDKLFKNMVLMSGGVKCKTCDNPFYADKSKEQNNICPECESKTVQGTQLESKTVQGTSESYKFTPEEEALMKKDRSFPITIKVKGKQVPFNANEEFTVGLVKKLFAKENDMIDFF